jgi:hypothetical protein
MEDALYGREMGLTGVVHVEEHLLDRIGDVKPGEGEILESLGQDVVGGWVTDGAPNVGGDLGLSVDWRGAGLVVAQASTLKDVSSVLALVKEEVIELLLY